MRDPFSWSYDQRQRLIPDKPWFGAALIVCGLAAALTWRSWFWIAAGVVAIGIGAALFLGWVLRRRRA